MNPIGLTLGETPTLSDETAVDMLAFLYEFIDAFEQAYGLQIARYEQHCAQQPDLFENFEDEILF
jgi:hypothetical protein